jgi:anthranilate phosphoribosyltransferase
VRVEPAREGLVDLCGTGGDGSGSFNISTTAALVVAGADVPVAKHGNRSASSQCGSADVLEALGVPIDLEPDAVKRSIEDIGFGFLFAPRHHPAMRFVGPSRKQLKLRTVFNILGPMTNPAGVTLQMIGVFDPAVRETMGRVLRQLGSERVWVLHGDGGLDEASIEGTTRVFAFDEDGEREFEITPEDAGIGRSPLSSLKGGDAATNAAIVEKILDGETGPHRDAVLLNAGVALVVSGKASDVKEGAMIAAEAIDGGGARRILEALRKTR